jgi:hypothetical protein
VKGYSNVYVLVCTRGSICSLAMREQPARNFNHGAVRVFERIK